MKRALPLLLILLGAGCAGRRAAPEAAAPPDPSYGEALTAYQAKAKEPEPPSEGTWSKALEAAMVKSLTMPSPPQAYAYSRSDEPSQLAEDVGHAAKFIALSEQYQRVAHRIPPSYWTEADRRRFDENEKDVEHARKILREGADGLLR